MSGPDVTQAEILTETGHRFTAPIANLGTTGLFLQTSELLQFGQRLSLRLLGVPVRGEVLFVSSDPVGAVVGLRASASALATLEAHRREVEVVSGPPALEDPWAEETTTSLPPTDDGILDDLEVVVAALDAAAASDDTRTPLDVPIDPSLVVAAHIDDTGAHAQDEAEPDEVEPGADVPGGPTRRDEVVSSPSSPLTQGVGPVAPGGPTTDRKLHLVEPQAEAGDATPPEPIDATALSPPGDPDVDLPVLDGDGYTVRFASATAYQNQFASHISHGGLVVRAPPMSIGTQRMLSLVVPGIGTYTVSARVIFHTTGKLGFMLDSFSLHRDRLAEMAQAS